MKLFSRRHEAGVNSLTSHTLLNKLNLTLVVRIRVPSTAELVQGCDMATGATLPGNVTKKLAWGLVKSGILLLASAAAARFLVHYAAPYFRWDAKYFDVYWPHRFRLIVHISGGVVALICGTLQLWTGLRQKAMRFHRWTGRIYLAGVSVGILGAFLISAYSVPRSFAVALRCLAMAWLLTTGVAYAAILRGRVALHKEWMIRSYLVTFAFVSFRVMTEYLPGVTAKLGGVPRTIPWPI